MNLSEIKERKVDGWVDSMDKNAWCASLVPEFDPWISHRSGGIELTPKRHPLTFTCVETPVPWHTDLACAHTYKTLLDFVFCVFSIDIIIVILDCQFDYIWNELKQAPGQPVRNFPERIIRSRKTAAAQTKGHGRNFAFACLPWYLQPSSSHCCCIT